MPHRRDFLKFLAASPLLTEFSAFAQEVEETLGERLSDPSEVINVFEMEAVAREKIPPAHFGYLSTGVDSDDTLRANRAGFTRYQIKPRRLVDVSRPDLSVNVLGAEADSPDFSLPGGQSWRLSRRGGTGDCQSGGGEGTPHDVIHPVFHANRARGGSSGRAYLVPALSDQSPGLYRGDVTKSAGRGLHRGLSDH